MFADYRSQILETYHKMRAENRLSTNLAHPSPARLRTECLEALKRYTKKDEPALRSFFGAQADLDAYYHAIKKFDTDKFRPLAGVLKGNVADPDNKHIELLAWLIDYQPRPYVFGQSAAFERPEPSTLPDQPPAAGITVESETVLTDDQWTLSANEKTGNQPNTFISTTSYSRSVPQRKHRIVWSGILVILLSGMGFVAWRVLNESGKCMYWAGDHYQVTSCDVQIGDTTVYGFDLQRFDHFKRILKPDTISEKSLGRVWYIKMDGNMEYYTGPGLHPVYTERKLKPITAYIIDKYCLRNSATTDIK